MTHTLHREAGCSGNVRDLIFLCTPAKGVNSAGSAPRLARILDILHELGPANMGFYECTDAAETCSVEEAKERLHDHSRLRCVFDDRDKLVEVLRRVERESTGLSVAVTGPLEEVLEIAREVGLTPHTVNLSLGVFGRTSLLPSKEVREVSTMCGHGLISFRLVEETLVALRRGEITAEKSVRRLDRPCSCGMLNPTRAREILDGVATEGGEAPG